MRYTNLGRTGLKVSAFGLGCGNFGGIGSSPAFFGRGESEDEAFALMDAAYDLGVNFFDTADAYGGGRSETVIGKWLEQKGPSVRDQLIVSSKVFNPVGDGPNDWGLSRRHVMRQVEASLSRLGVDHLDLYLMHEPDPTTPLDETLRAFDDLVRQGKVRYTGLSNMPAWLTRKYRRGQTFPEGSRMTLRPDPYTGFLVDRVYDGLEALAADAAARDTTMAALALAWSMSDPIVTAPILGPRRPDQLQPGVDALQIHLTPEDRATIAGYFIGGAE
jgi:aryl-alcohol dehydrogenase-like predicted oxidoreductase